MAGESADGKKWRRVDVDRELRDVSRALDRWQTTRLALNFDSTFDGGAAEQHLRRLEKDPAYAARWDDLCHAAESWSQELGDFVEQHRADIDAMRLNTSPIISKRWRLRGLRRSVMRAEAKVRAMEDAGAALVRLTGAQDIESAVKAAGDPLPRLSWNDFEAALDGAQPADRGLFWTVPDPGETLPDSHYLRVALQNVEAARRRLDEVRVEAAVDEDCDPDSRARSLCSAIDKSDTWGWVSRARRGTLAPGSISEQQLRSALRDLGFPEAATLEELAENARVAASAHPDNVQNLLSRARYSADELMRLTGTGTVREAVRAAERTLRMNRGYEEPRARPTTVVSGGLPGLGKRR